MNRSIVTIAILACATTAHAQPAGAQAEVLFRQGRELLAAGKIAEACAAFAQSQKLEPAVTTLLNLAGCRERAGQLATAWGLFLDAERATRAATDAATKQLHDLAADHAAKLEPRVSKLAIHVAADSQIEGLEILRDNERVEPALWNSALPVDGGTYTITARAPGTSAWSTSIQIAAESDSQTVEIPKLQGAPAMTPPVTTAPTPTPSPAKPDLRAAAPLPPPSTRAASIELVVAAGGAVALGVGALAFELSGEQSYAEAKAETASQSHRDALYSSANTAHTAAGALAIGGIAAAGAATWFVVRDRERTLPSPYVFAGGALGLGVVALAFELSGDATYDAAKKETTNQARRNALYDGATSKRDAAVGVGVAALACAGIAVWRFARGHDGEARTALVAAPNGIALTGRFR